MNATALQEMTSKGVIDITFDLPYIRFMKNSTTRDQSQGRKQAGPASDLKPRPKATTFRLDPPVQDSLLKLQRFLNVPQNRLVNEAVKIFVEQKTSEVVANVEDLVASVRLHREADPDFEQAISHLVNAESELGGADPVEGSAFAELAPGNTDKSKPAKGKRKGTPRG
jgi:16S rRNA G966 N2-methylase RsmD